MDSVKIVNLTKRFGENTVLSHFDESFHEGEFVTLLGPSGCGKTTMLRILAGFEKPTEGEVYIGGVLVTGPKTFVPPEKRRIGMVFQSYAVWPHMNVWQNVAYPLQIQKLSKDETNQKVARALEMTHLTQYAYRTPDSLSGGQQQRVALARALVGSPSLLLLDEPLSNLDAKLRESMRYEIKEIQQALGMTVVYVTHDRTEAMAMSDRILLINGGVVQQSGTPREIYNRPVNPFVADFLGRVDFFRGEIRNGRVFFEEMGGQSIPCKEERTGPADVAVRPENVVLRDDGPIEGKIESLFYLGDVTDLRVRAGDALIRLTAPGSLIDEVKPGHPVRLDFKNCLYFDKGTASEEALGIKT